MAPSAPFSAHCLRPHCQCAPTDAAAAAAAVLLLGPALQAAKAKAKLDAAREKAERVAKAPPPKVEVGSFEEVVSRMTQAEGADLASWSQIMFVAPGLLSASATQPVAAPAASTEPPKAPAALPAPTAKK